MNDEREHNLMIAIFSVSAGMVGVCLTGVGLLQVANSVRRIETLADELLVADAVLFLCSCLLIFLSFRVRHEGVLRRLRKIGDVLFFLGLMLMVSTGGVIAAAFI